MRRRFSGNFAAAVALGVVVAGVTVIAQLPTVATAQSGAPAKKVTLAEAVDFAVKRRGDLRAAKLQIKVAQAENTQVNARFLPVLTGNASANIGLAGSFAGLGLVGLSMSPYKNLIGGSVDAVWEVFDFGRTLAESNAESHEIDAARATAENVERIIRFQTTDLYLRCLSLRARTSLARRQLTTAEAAATTASKQSKAGMIAETDAEIARLTVDQDRRELLAAQRAAESCTLHLAGYIGSPHDLDLVDVSADTPAPVRASKSLIANALKNRPDKRAQLKQAKAWDSRVTAAGLDHLPKVRAVGSLGWALLNENVVKYIHDSDLNHGFYALGVGVQVPIFEGGAIMARMRVNQHRRDAQTAKARDLERLITAQVRAAANAWQVAHEQQLAAKSEAARADKVESSAEKRFRAGLSNIDAWALARNLAFRSRVAFDSSRYQVLRAQNALLFASAMADQRSKAAAPAK